jgi:hypothetical protein
MGNHSSKNNGSFHRGPVCKVCQSETADLGETVCFRCLSTFRNADLVASNRQAIRIDMEHEGMLRMFLSDQERDKRRGGRHYDYGFTHPKHIVPRRRLA